MSRAHFGGRSGGWAEATDPFASYETVISELEKLSTLLSDSIEGLSIAVLTSHKGYENVIASVICLAGSRGSLRGKQPATAALTVPKHSYHSSPAVVASTATAS